MPEKKSFIYFSFTMLIYACYLSKKQKMPGEQFGNFYFYFCALHAEN